MTGTITTLRRAVTGSPSSLSAARQALADAITAQAAAAEQAGLLASALLRARAEAAAAESALDRARETAERADREAFQVRVARLTGTAGPDVPTREEAGAALAAAEHGVRDAVAASRSIADTLGELQAGEHGRDDRIAEAARGVLADELRDDDASLIAEIDALHRRLVDAGRAFHWLVRAGVVRTFGAGATPGAGHAEMAVTHGAISSALWGVAGASPTEARLAGTLDALQRDAGAPVPSLR